MRFVVRITIGAGKNWIQHLGRTDVPHEDGGVTEDGHGRHLSWCLLCGSIAQSQSRILLTRQSQRCSFLERTGTQSRSAAARSIVQGALPSAPPAMATPASQLTEETMSTPSSTPISVLANERTCPPTVPQPLHVTLPPPPSAAAPLPPPLKLREAD